MKTLLAVTTYNQLEYTKKFVSSLKGISIPGLDVTFFDDVSTDGTQDYLKSSGFTLFERARPMGLTHSWNLAYQKFKNENYDVLILANNDVLVNQAGLQNLIGATGSHHLVCPLTTKLGAGHNWQNQAIGVRYPKIRVDASKPGNMDKFNGFFFAMSRGIISAAHSKENLFDPKNTNVHQERDLQSRMKQKPAVCLGSFIYHFKGVSFPVKGTKNGKDVRQNLNIYH
jgi:hypothetical protein